MARHVSNTNLESYAMLYGTHFVGGQDSLIDQRYLNLLLGSETSANLLSILNARYIGRTGDPAETPWCGQRYASPLPIIEVSAEMSPVRLVLDEPLSYSSIAIHWAPLAEGGAATIHVNGDAHALLGETPLRISASVPDRLETLELSVPPGSPGVRIEDIELDLNPIGLRADFIRWGNIRLNLHALPRAYVAETLGSSAGASSEKAADGALDCWSVHRPVVIDSSESVGPAFFRRGSAKILSYAPEEIIIETEARRSGFLVVADTYHPGWSAAVDGTPSSILRAFDAFRAIPLEAGAHRVRLWYRPRSLYWGAALNLFGVAIALLVALYGGILSKGGRVPAPADPQDEAVGNHEPYPPR